VAAELDIDLSKKEQKMHSGRKNGGAKQKDDRYKMLMVSQTSAKNKFV